MNNQAGKCAQSSMDIIVIRMTETKSIFEDEFKIDTHDGNDLDSMDPITLSFKIQSNKLFLFISQVVV